MAASQSEREFARGMRLFRTAKGMSQVEVASRLVAYGIDLDGTAITRIEKNATGLPGARVLRFGEAVAIADIFGLSVMQVCSYGTELDPSDADPQYLPSRGEMGSPSLLIAAKLRLLAEEIEGGLADQPAIDAAGHGEERQVSALAKDGRPESMVPYPTIHESGIVPEVHIVFRECADGEWAEVAPGVSVQTDGEGRLAHIEIETWKHAARTGEAASSSKPGGCNDYCH